MYPELFPIPVGMKKIATSTLVVSALTMVTSDLQTLPDAPSLWATAGT